MRSSLYSASLAAFGDGARGCLVTTAEARVLRVVSVVTCPSTAILPVSIHFLASDQETSASVRTTLSRGRPPSSAGTVHEASGVPSSRGGGAGAAAVGRGERDLCGDFCGFRGGFRGAMRRGERASKPGDGGTNGGNRVQVLPWIFPRGPCLRYAGRDLWADRSRAFKCMRAPSLVAGKSSV